MPTADPEQHILDAATASPDADGRLLIDDPGILGLRKYPDVEQMQPGDVLLFAPKRPTWQDRVIMKAQEARGWGREHAAWTHAAIFVRGATLVEANYPRVRVCALWPRVPDHRIRVRRATGRNDPKTFGYRLALEMTTRLGESYDGGVLWRIPLYAALRRGRGAHQSSAGRVFCSQIIADSFAALREGPIHDVPDLDTFSQTSPAHLSDSKVLQDVPIRWLFTRN